jgi:hypothetical protein
MAGYTSNLGPNSAGFSNLANFSGTSKQINNPWAGRSMPGGIGGFGGGFKLVTPKLPNAGMAPLTSNQATNQNGNANLFPKLTVDQQDAMSTPTEALNPNASLYTPGYAGLGGMPGVPAGWTAGGTASSNYPVWAQIISQYLRNPYSETVGQV